MKEELAIVLIGRNESRRLRRGIEAALASDPACVVYVDSGSTDDSVAIARSFGERVLVDELDRSAPFTPARGRNLGFRHVRAKVPRLRFVQFVDGDCVLSPGWVDTALAFLEANPDAAVVAGRLREENRERNVYHRLADMEWDVPTGDVESTGGIAMMRADDFEAAGGFDGSVAAGEELELALRLRAARRRIVRLAADMATHDIDMAAFDEWWRRAVRSGHSYAEGLYLQSRHGHELHLKELASIVAWGAVLPGAALGLALPTLGTSLGLLGAYGLLHRRVRAHRLSRGDRADDASLYAHAVVAQKVASALGVARFARAWASGNLAHGAHMLAREAHAPSRTTDQRVPNDGAT